MKDWYVAVCDRCGEATHVIVNGPNQTEVYLGEHNAEICEWLREHQSHDLRLIVTDQQMEALFDSGYKHVERGDWRWDKALKKNVQDKQFPEYRRIPTP